MDRLEVVPGLAADVLDGIVGRLRGLEPSTIAVLVSGSYAKGTLTRPRIWTSKS